MSAGGWAPTFRAGLPGRFRRPEGIAESTRWLFAVLSLISLLLTVSPPLASARGGVLLLAVAAALTLTGTSVFVYLSRRVPPGLDVLDAVAITGFALACSDPAQVIGYAFAAMWFRGLYGSTWQALTRCGLYVAAIAASLPLWTLNPGHPVTPAAAPVIGTFPLMFLTVIVARQLGGGLLARERSLRRDAALATSSTQLLGVTDAAAVRAIAWDASTEVCAATPGLRLLKAVRHGPDLRVEGATGGFATVPVTLPGDVITTPASVAEARVADPAPLDRAVGAPLEWVCMTLPAEGDAWLLVGAPNKIPAEAIPTVRSLVNQTALALRNSAVHHELIAQARVDVLTGLSNRASFTTELARQLAHRRPASALQVLFVDLDDFKFVNDILGHHAGDDVLVEVAARLGRCTRPDDLCARLGGDEFAVLLHDTTDASAAEIAQRMVDSIAEPIHLGDRTARVGASIGIATATNGIDIDELVHHADVAMYAAKAHGKGRTQPFTPGLLQADTSRLSFERELEAAAAAGELVMYYQPVLSLPDLRCIAVEALVRWQHPERGLLAARDFIDNAECTAAITDIGGFVLRHACAQAAAWQRDYPESALAVHVDVSASQLDHDRFIDTVTQCLREFRIPAALLVLELTETAVLRSPDAIERLHTLASLGVQIAVDDFGAGYSSLSTLRSLPVDVIKLDATSIAGAGASPVDRTVIEAIVAMSAQLGLRTIAEGVERGEQQRFLEGVGVDAAQGSLYLAPVPAGQLAIWLDANLDGEPDRSSTVIPIHRGRRAQ